MFLIDWLFRNPTPDKLAALAKRNAYKAKRREESRHRLHEHQIRKIMRRIRRQIWWGGFSGREKVYLLAQVGEWYAGQFVDACKKVEQEDGIKIDLFSDSDGVAILYKEKS